MARYQISLGDFGLSRVQCPVNFVFKLAFLIVFGKEVGLIQVMPNFQDSNLKSIIYLFCDHE